MNSSEITRILTRVCGDLFGGVYARDELPPSLPRRPILFIANTDPAARKGQHWVALWFDIDGQAEYFDSLAQEPHRTFKDYLNVNSVRWIANEKQIQSVASRFCGAHVIVYAAFRAKGWDINRLCNKTYTNDTGLNDVIAHSLVCARAGV